MRLHKKRLEKTLERRFSQHARFDHLFSQELLFGTIDWFCTSTKLLNLQLQL